MLDGRASGVTVKIVHQGPPASIIGMLDAVCDEGGGSELADALHPMLRTWVHHGGEDPLWQDAVLRLRGGHTTQPGDLLSYHFDAASALLAETSQAEGVSWVRNVELEKRSEALARHLSAFGQAPDEETVQLVADVLDATVPGIVPVYGGRIASRHLTTAAFADVLMHRAEPLVDVQGAGMLRGHDLSLVRSLLEAVRDGRVTVTSGGVAMLSSEEEIPKTWLVLLAAGIRRHVLWNTEWSWRELARASVWAADPADLVQLARLAERGSQRVLHPRLNRTNLEDRALVAETAHALLDPARIAVREVLGRLLPTELVCAWAELPAHDGGLRDDELVAWARDGVGRNMALDNAMVALSHTRLGERVAEAIFEHVPNIADSALWGGSEDVGYATGRYLAKRINDQATWSLVLAMSRGFQGTIRELADAACVLSGATS